MEHKMNRGGARPGAGRKRQSEEHRKVAVNVRISSEAAEWLQELSSTHSLSKSQIMEYMIMNTRDLTADLKRRKGGYEQPVAKQGDAMSSY